MVTKVESCLVLPASVNLKRGDCRKLYCRGGSSDRSSFVGVWVAETNGVKTVLGFMGKSQLKESEKSQCETQSEVNQCGGNKSRLKKKFGISYFICKKFQK